LNQMKKIYYKIFFIFAILSILYLFTILLVKHVSFNYWASKEIFEKGEVIFGSNFCQEEVSWENRIQYAKRTAKLIKDSLLTTDTSGRFVYNEGNSSLRYFEREKNENYSLGIYISDKKTPKDKINKILKNQYFFKNHFQNLFQFFLSSFFISKDNWMAVFPYRWAEEIEDGHDLRKNQFYFPGIPQNNPDKKPLFTDLYFDDIWGKWLVTLLIPVYVDGEFEGIVGHSLDIEAILASEKNKNFYNQGSLFLLNGLFDFRYHHNLELVFKRSDFELNEKFRFNGEVKEEKAKKIVEQLKDKFFDEKILKINQVKYFTYIRQIPGLGWYYVYVVKQDQFISNIDKGINSFILFCTIAFILILVFLLVFFKITLFSPVRLLVKNLSKFQSTDSEKIITGKSDYLGKLNNMFINIENIFGHLNSNIREIEESKEYIETLMKTVQVFIVVLNRRLKPIYLNDYALDKLNIKKEEISDLKIFDFVEKSFIKKLAKDFESANNILNKEMLLFLKDGTKIDVDVSASKLVNASNELIGYIAVVADITQRKKAEMNLKNQIAFSRQIFKTIPDIILILDNNLKIVFYNQKAQKIVGKPSTADQSISNFLSKTSLEIGFDQSLRNILYSGDFIKQINVLNPFRGESNYVDLIIEPLKTASGIIGCLILLRDVSEWRSLTEKIKNLQMFMEKLIDASPYAIISINEYDNISVWNKTAERLFKIRNENAMNKNLFDICPFFLSYKDLINEVKILNRTYFLGDQKMDFEGEPFVVLNLNFYPILSEGRNVVINVEDVSEIKKLEDSLLQAQKMESLGLLTSGIIHDFNNVLSGIIGYASLLDKQISEDSELKKYATNIMSSSERASGMIRQILDFSKKRLAKEEVLEINGIIEELLGFLKLNLKNVNVKKVLSKDRIFLRADRTKISQVIINLIINAKEALERSPEPKITVMSDEVTVKDKENLLDGRYAIVEISDNGPGIKKANLEKIFEPFFSTKSKTKSTGIGLATVREIILDYNGEIEVKSALNKGTSFIFYLPSVQEDIYDAVVETKEKLETKIEGSVLLIDDEKVVRDIGRDMLSSVGIKCLTAANGEEGVKLFKENKENISVVILDVEMPGMSGDKVAEVIKKIKPDVRVLFASGYTKDYLESKVFKGKINNFMPKPFFLNQLLFKLNEVIESDSTP